MDFLQPSLVALSPHHASATGSYAVAIGGDSVADEAMTVSVGAGGFYRRITNVDTPINANDAANRATVDAVAGTASANAAELAYFVAKKSTGGRVGVAFGL